MKIETRSFPNSLAATLATLPSRPLIPAAPFCSTNALIAGWRVILPGHSVTTVSRRGWAGIKNGDLLKLAEKEYDVFVTVDRKLSVQQDLTAFDIAVVLIRSRSNRLEDIRPLAPEILGAISRATGRALTSVDNPSIVRAS